MSQETQTMMAPECGCEADASPAASGQMPGGVQGSPNGQGSREYAMGGYTQQPEAQAAGGCMESTAQPQANPYAMQPQATPYMMQPQGGETGAPQYTQAPGQMPGQMPGQAPAQMPEQQGPQYQMQMNAPMPGQMAGGQMQQPGSPYLGPQPRPFVPPHPMAAPQGIPFFPTGPMGPAGSAGQMAQPFSGYAAYGSFAGQAPVYGGAPAMGQPASGAQDGMHDGDACGCSAHAEAGGPHSAHDPKHLENKYGQLYGMISEAANGNPDISKFMNFFSSTSSDFWKGALVGAGLTLLLTNDTIKAAIAGSVSSVWGTFSKKAEDMEAEEDRKAEERAAKEASK